MVRPWTSRVMWHGAPKDHARHRAWWLWRRRDHHDQLALSWHVDRARADCCTAALASRAGCLDLQRGARRRCGGAMSMAKVLFLRRIKRDIPGQAALMTGSYKPCP